MFDTYMICEDGFSNIAEHGKVTGFQLGIRLAYYRGLGLTMVEAIDLAIDGEAFSRDELHVTLYDQTYTLDEMESATEVRWEFGDVGILAAGKPGGLAQGPHKIELTEKLRVSYFPVLLVGKDTKVLSLSAQPAPKERAT